MEAEPGDVRALRVGEEVLRQDQRSGSASGGPVGVLTSDQGWKAPRK